MKRLDKFLLLSILILALIPISTLNATPRVSLTIDEIKKTSTGFIVYGNVEVSGLNEPVLGNEPEKQAGDSIEIIVDIIEPGGTFNTLPEWYSIGLGSLMVGDRKLTQEEVEGIECTHISGWGVTIRSIINPVVNPEPDHYSASFNFTIPLEYEGKTVRIRATETHTISDTWPYITYWHDIAYMGELKEIRTGQITNQGEEQESEITKIIEKVKGSIEAQGTLKTASVLVVTIGTVFTIAALKKHRRMPPPPPPEELPPPPPPEEPPPPPSEEIAKVREPVVTAKNVLKVLIDKFNIAGISDAEDDIKLLVA